MKRETLVLIFDIVSLFLSSLAMIMFLIMASNLIPYPQLSANDGISGVMLLLIMIETSTFISLVTSSIALLGSFILKMKKVVPLITFVVSIIDILAIAYLIV